MRPLLLSVTAAAFLATACNVDRPQVTPDTTTVAPTTTSTEPANTIAAMDCDELTTELLRIDQRIGRANPESDTAVDQIYSDLIEVREQMTAKGCL